MMQTRNLSPKKMPTAVAFVRLGRQDHVFKQDLQPANHSRPTALSATIPSSEAKENLTDDLDMVFQPTLPHDNSASVTTSEVSVHMLQNNTQGMSTIIACESSMFRHIHVPFTHATKFV